MGEQAVLMRQVGTGWSVQRPARQERIVGILL